MNPRKLMAVALCATACVTTTAFAEDDDLVADAKPVTIADPINPKPGMVFKGYNLNTQYDDKFLAIKATLDSAAPVKSTVVTSEEFTFEPFRNEVRINQGVWEGFLKCKRTAQCTFLLKQRGDYSGGGFLLFVNGKKVVGQSGTGQLSANVQLKAGFNHIVLISQAQYPVAVFLSPVGSVNPPKPLSPAIMFYDDKPVDDVI